MQYNVWNRVNIPVKLRKKVSRNYSRFLRLRGTEKVLQLFFSFSFSSLFLGRLAKDFKWFLSVFFVDMCDQVRESIIGHTSMTDLNILVPTPQNGRTASKLFEFVTPFCGIGA